MTNQLRLVFADPWSKPVVTLVVTVFGEESHVMAALAEEASGYFLDSAVADGGETPLQTGLPLSLGVTRRLLERLRLPASTARAVTVVDKVVLSTRETEVLNLIARGCSYKEVSSALAISNVTVATHLQNTYQKLAVHSKSEAVYEASKLGLIAL